MRRIPALAAIVAPLAAALVVGGCSLFDGDDEEEVTAAQEAAVEASYEPVEEVRQIEIGRTRDGLVITVYAVAPGLGYAGPDLRPRREGRPGPDGFLDYDFVVRAPFNPPAATADASARARQVRADELVNIQEMRGVQGIRVHAAEGGMMMNF